MASAQCYKYEQDETNRHKGQQKEHSLTKKVSDMASSIFKGHGSHKNHDQTQTHYSHHFVGKKSQTQQCYGQPQGHRSQPQAQHHVSQPQLVSHGHDASMGKTKKRGERKKTGLIQKIKDGFSSGRDSESDDEKSGRKY